MPSFQALSHGPALACAGMHIMRVQARHMLVNAYDDHYPLPPKFCGASG